MTDKAVHRCDLVISHLMQPPKTTTLCFLDAFHAYKSSQISWDEYLGHLLIHFTGVKHEEDSIGGMYSALRYADPFGYSIFCWNQVLQQKLSDIGPFKATFEAYQRGAIDETQDGLAALDEDHVSAKRMRGSVALLALKKRQAKMLEMCLNLEGGFPYEAYFVDEADRVEESKDPETFRVLERSTLREYYPRQPPGGPGRDDNPAATFDRGGSLPVDW